MKLWKYSGRFLTATGMIHILFAAVRGWDVYREIFSGKLINAIGTDLQRAFTFWFLMTGILLIVLGETLHYYLKREQRPAPQLLGYALLAISVVGCILIPLSGFWLFIPQALIIIFAGRQQPGESTHPATEPGKHKQ